MKKKNIFLFCLAVMVIVAIFTMAGCPTSTDPTPPKVVEAKWRFSGGVWHSPGLGTQITGAVSALGEKTFTVTGSVTISRSGLWTEGGGTQDDIGPWAYLYDSSGKIGVVQQRYGTIVAIFGATTVQVYLSADLSGMQDTFRGFAAAP